MRNVIQRSINLPIREDLSWKELWKSNDSGLIRCWEAGRNLAVKEPSLATKALNDELPVLPWKGGVKKKPETLNEKYGSLMYLAMWQGLRGDDLNIDLDNEYELICSETKMKVIFTSDPKKYVTIST